MSLFKAYEWMRSGFLSGALTRAYGCRLLFSSGDYDPALVVPSIGGDRGNSLE